MLKQAVQEWLQESGSYAVEVRLGSMSSLLAGFLLRNRVVASVFLAAVPIGAIVLSTWSEYFVRRWKTPFRTGSRGGLAFGCTLVPLVLVATCVCAESHKVRNLDVLYYYISLMSTCSLMSMISTVCLMVPRPNNYGLVVVASLVLSVLGHTYIPGVAPGFLWFLLPLWVFLALGAFILWAMPNSFSAGEAVIVAQSVFLLVFDVGLQTLRQLQWMDVPRMFIYSRSLSHLAVEVMLVYALLVGLIIIWPWHAAISWSQSYPSLRPLTSSHQRWSIGVTCSIVASFFFLLLPWMQLAMNTNILLWLVHYLLRPSRLLLAAYWLLCLGGAYATVRHGFLQRKVLSTNRLQLMVSRKKFHVLAVAIFVPGLMWDQELLLLASGVAVTMLVLVEYVRILKIWPIGSALDQHLRSFVDSRDSGHVILTHIYLLVGFAMPCFAFPLSHFKSAPKLATFAGALSLGFGDSAASLVGMKWGRVKWPKMDKTVVGSLAFVVAELLLCALVSFWDADVYAHLARSWFYVIPALSAASVLEAFSGHIDNLILPPYLFALLSLT